MSLSWRHLEVSHSEVRSICVWSQEVTLNPCMGMRQQCQRDRPFSPGGPGLPLAGTGTWATWQWVLIRGRGSAGVCVLSLELLVEF